VWGSSVSSGKALAASFQLVKSRDFHRPLGGASQVDEVLSFNPDLVVADGYHFEKEFFDALDQRDIPYGVIDDNGETEAAFPLFVVNQNPSAERSMYQDRFPEAELFLGVKFALLRREVRFLAEKDFPQEQRVLVSMGGSDPAGLSLPIAAVLAKQNIKSRVVLGPAVVNREKILENLDSLEKVEVADSAQLLADLANCDVSVLAAGSTLWEAGALRSRVLAIVVAENQLAPAEAALSNGMVESVLDLRPPQKSLNGLDSIPDAIRGIRARPASLNGLRHLDGATRVARAVTRRNGS